MSWNLCVRSIILHCCASRACMALDFPFCRNSISPAWDLNLIPGPCDLHLVVYLVLFWHSFWYKFYYTTNCCIYIYIKLWDYIILSESISLSLLISSIWHVCCQILHLASIPTCSAPGPTAWTRHSAWPRSFFWPRATQKIEHGQTWSNCWMGFWWFLHGFLR